MQPCTNSVCAHIRLFFSLSSFPYRADERGGVNTDTVFTYTIPPDAETDSSETSPSSCGSYKVTSEISMKVKHTSATCNYRKTPPFLQGAPDFSVIVEHMPHVVGILAEVSAISHTV